LGFDIVSYSPPKHYAPLPESQRQLPLPGEGVVERLKEVFLYPRVDSSVKSFLWSIDGGGRELIEQMIVDKDVRLLLEIGSFLGGSAERWLRASPNLVVVCLDPWLDAWAGNYVAKHGYAELRDQLNRENGFFMTFLANLWNYRARVVPVRKKSPEGLLDLFLFDLQPDLIYIDANKASDSIRVCHQLWPSAILTGDDWNWSKEGGKAPVQEAVTKLASAHGCEILQQKETWVLIKNRR
jgi:hypothetical protein